MQPFSGDRPPSRHAPREANMGRKTRNNRTPPAAVIPASGRGAEPSAKNRRNAAIVCGLLLLAVAAIYGQTLRCEFVNFDDGDYVKENPYLSRGLSAEGIAWAFTATRCNNWHPLTWLSLLLDHAWYGPAPWGYHLTNVLLHAANSVLLFLVLWRMTGDLWPSAFAAALFAVHPLRVESVAWVSERKDVLSGLFFMLTLGAYVGYVRRSTATWSTAAPGCVTAEGGRAPRTGRYLVVVLLFALGLMAKPMLVTLPFVLLLLDYWPLGRMRDSHSLRRLVLEKLPMLALSAVSCVVTSLAQGGAIQSIDQFPLDVRLQNALVSYAVYLRQFFYPVGLAVFYPHPEKSLPLWQTAGAMLLVAGLSGYAILRRRERPWLPVGWFWFLGMLVPVIGLVQVGRQAMADRYAYLPQIGLALALAWYLKRAVEAHPRRAAALVAVAVAAILLLTVAAARQASHWRDGETLWRRALECTERNAVAHSSLGRVLFDRGRIDDALEQFEKSLAVRSDYAETHNNLGVLRAKQQRFDEATAHYETALKLKPDHAAAHRNYGATLYRQGRAAEAVARFQAALRYRPDDPATLSDLGAAYMKLRRYDDAIAAYRQALDVQRDYVPAWNNLAVACAESGRPAEAARAAREALDWAAKQNDPARIESIRAMMRKYRLN